MLHLYAHADFDFGVEVLRGHLEETRFPWLLSNVLDRRTGEPLGGAKRSHVLTWQVGRAGGGSENQAGSVGLPAQLALLPLLPPPSFLEPRLMPCQQPLEGEMQGNAAPKCTLRVTSMPAAQAPRCTPTCCATPRRAR